jgi:hypothetical protein
MVGHSKTNHTTQSMEKSEPKNKQKIIIIKNKK